MIDIDRISAEAARIDVRPGRVLQTAVAAVFWSVGYLARKTVQAAGWCWVAVKVGWADGGPPKGKR